ncbi:MAG: molybdopterin-binding protein, partial [Promethearchaeota archaeon]
MNIEIVLTGNELLIGKISDTNGKWIIDQVTPLGIQVSRITIIPDDEKIIASTISECLNRNPDYIITSGGLGPTFDDMTLKGIAKSFNPPKALKVNSTALKMIWDRFKKKFPNKTHQEIQQRYAYIDKMANLPGGSYPLSNRVGTAPGIYIPSEITNGITKIIALPGIPRELKAIFNDHILPELKRSHKQKNFHECGFIFTNVGESRFTQKVYEIKDNFPDLWIKTHPRKSEFNKWELELHITSFNNKPEILTEM